MVQNGRTSTSSGWKLIPLTPEFLPDEHGKYVTALESALDKGQVRNIALSGNYGVGKSSILKELARKQNSRVVELSLSTLAPIEVSKLDESVPIQATTPTNRIQQEIVKQLLYREDPSKTRGSRFKRIERFRRSREGWNAVLFGLIVALVFLLKGWSAKLAAEFKPLGDCGFWIHLFIWAIAAIVTFSVRRLLYGKLRIKQFSAGPATVMLDDNSVSYFDQYLDEIVYFFEVSERDIVIFEDIDRFDDPHIFETLRALNTLLNAAPQIKKPIRFIYAIKDSIFDRIGLGTEGDTGESDPLDDPVRAEMVRANRTKFFDLVIPVVPFITHRSARNLAVKLLGEIEHKVDPQLLDLAAQYVPDMRLLKNVCNEFIVFRDRIFSGDGKELVLSETDLFAMMLYKSTHLTDFEKIRLGTSVLDSLYKVSRELVAYNIKKLERERRELLQKISRKNRAESRSIRLGELLLAHLERTATWAAAMGTRRQNGVSLSIDGISRSDADLKTVEFWSSFVAAEGDPKLHQSMSAGYQLVFSRSSLSVVLGDSLDPDSWDEGDLEFLSEQLGENRNAIDFLRGADMGDLIKRPEFLITSNEFDTTAIEESTKSTMVAEQSFESVAKKLLKSNLAYQLVRAGYINRNFTLYTSTFHGDRVSPAATNFIIHHVERDVMDVHFKLSPEDVDAVVRECGENTLQESAMYNIAILDCLLASNGDAADIMIGALVELGESQLQFLQAYLPAGEQRLHFVERFTSMSSQSLIYLVNQVELDETLRLELVDTVLANLSSPAQHTDARVIDFLRTHYAELPVLNSIATSSDQAERVATLFADAGIVVPSLTPLGPSACASFVSRSLYDITYENLIVAIDNDETVALDVIRVANRTVYDYVLENLDSYLNAVEEASATICSRECFIAVLKDLLEKETPRLEDVIRHATQECQVADLGVVAEGGWPALAVQQRFPETFSNVNRYIATYGVDGCIASLLRTTGRIIDVASANDEEKMTLAIALLESKNQLPASLRVELVASLELDSYLEVEDIDIEKGDLFALLLKHEIIEDAAEAYKCLATTDWLTRAAYIRESKNFTDYMTPDLVQSDVEELLTSDTVDDTIKREIVEQSETYVPFAGPKGLKELARLALQSGHTIPIDVVQEMAEGGVDAQYVVTLLESHFDVITRDSLFAILQNLPDDYPLLTTVGHKPLYIADTPADRALLECLKQHGTVSSYDPDTSLIKVNMKRKLIG